MSDELVGLVLALLLGAMVAALWFKPTDFDNCVELLSQDGISRSIAAERCARLAQ